MIAVRYSWVETEASLQERFLPFWPDCVAPHRAAHAQIWLHGFGHIPAIRFILAFCGYCLGFFVDGRALSAAQE